MIQELSRWQLGVVILVLAVAFFFVILSFTLEIQNLNSFLHKDCTLPAEVCPFNTFVPAQSVFAFTLDALLAATGILMIITRKQAEKLSAQTTAKIKTIIKNLEPDEQKIFSMIADSGAIFQSELVEKSNMNKVKVTRILDKLEGRGLVERKRRGMTNVVILKQ